MKIAFILTLLLISTFAAAERMTFSIGTARAIPAIFSDKNFLKRLGQERIACRPTKEQVSIDDEGVTFKKTNVVSVVFVWTCANGSTSYTGGHYEIQTGAVFF